MARESKFDSEKLREMVLESKTANEIAKFFNISKATLKSHLYKLSCIDNKLYEAPGMNQRIIDPKIKKNGLNIPLEELMECGFAEGETVSFEKQGDGVLIVKKQA